MRNIKLKFLKVKIKSLAAEQGIIRLEERRALKADEKVLYWRLAAHRQWDVRQEIRSALIAYGLLRGKEIADMEPRCKRPIDQKRVNELVKKYGTFEDRQRLLTTTA